MHSLRLPLPPAPLRLHWRDTEVVRLIDCPIRDADWRTLPTVDTAIDPIDDTDAFGYRRHFATLDGSIEGTLAVEARATDAVGAVTAALTLTARRATRVNRAGFVVLHPILGVAGTPLEVRHPDGPTELTRFPEAISPGQPVLAIAGLRHVVDGVAVAIDFHGEVFEMEDQRNWTDASFKTYCRPLARPRPYDLAAGETVRQTIRVTLTAASGPLAASGRALPPVAATMPAILLAHEPGLVRDHQPEPGPGLLLRVDARSPEIIPRVVAPRVVALEIVTDDDPAADLAAVAGACRAAGVAPARITALPRAYLASHQPDGPWPAGPAPQDLVPLVRAAFPDADAGGGALTNFTEFNRCRPDPAAIDFATFGTTAIVHAADDRAVAETLEALPQVIASAAALVPGRPLHLGLVSIGMRSNPYGAAVAPNPDGARLAMAMDDPRQRTPFAAAFAIAAAAIAAREGVASLAPAMAAGPLGTGTAADPWPIAAAVSALADLAGLPVTIEGGPTGLVAIRGAGRTLAANLGPDPAEIDGTPVPPYGFALTGDQQ